MDTKKAKGRFPMKPAKKKAKRKPMVAGADADTRQQALAELMMAQQQRGA